MAFNLAGLGPELLQAVLAKLPPPGKARAALVCWRFNTAVRATVDCLELPIAAAATYSEALAWRLPQPPPPAGTRVKSPPPPPHKPCAGPSQQQQLQRPPLGPASDAAQEQLRRRAAPPEPQLLQRLAGRYPALRSLRLHLNTMLAPSALAMHLSPLTAITQLQRLELMDACFWKLPWSWAGLSALTQLTQLRVVVQSPGTLSQVPGPGDGAGWQALFARQLSVLSSLTRLASLQCRCVAGERGFATSSELLPACEPLTALTSLDLGYVTLGPGAFGRLRRLTALQALVLYGDYSQMGLRELAALAPLRRLKRLELFHDAVTHFDARPAEQPTAQDLLAVMGALVGMTALEWVNLPIGTSTKPALAMLQQLPSLRELYAQNIEVEQLDSTAVMPCLPGSRLSALQLDNMTLSAEVLGALAPLTQLRNLVLFNILPSLDAPDQLTCLSTLTNLRYFCLDTLTHAANPDRDPQLDDSVLTALAAGWTRLESLHFTYSFSELHAAGGNAPVVLRELSRLTALRDLSLSSMGVAFVVLDSMRLPQGVRSLCLNQISLGQVANLPPGLEHVWLSDCLVQDAHLLPERLPKLRTLVVKRSVGGLDLLSDQLLAGLSNLKDLTTLGLSTSWQYSSLAPLAALTGLEKLVVDCDAADQDEGALDGLDATALYQQLLSLTALTRLRGLWVSDNMACGGGDLMVLQHVLQASAPCVCVRPAQSDWYWRSSFPIGAQLDEPNPMLWWLWSAWNIL